MVSDLLNYSSPLYLKEFSRHKNFGTGAARWRHSPPQKMQGSEVEEESMDDGRKCVMVRPR